MIVPEPVPWPPAPATLIVTTEGRSRSATLVAGQAPGDSASVESPSERNAFTIRPPTTPPRRAATITARTGPRRNSGPFLDAIAVISVIASGRYNRIEGSAHAPG